jgi:hypothetical protein
MNNAHKLILMMSGAPAVPYVAQWKLNNNTIDSIGANHLTTVVGAPTYAAGLGGATGALHLVRTEGQYVQVASNSVLQMGDIDFTICAWVNPASLVENEVILGKWKTANEYILIVQSNRYVFIVNSSDDTVGTVVANTFGQPPTAAWHFIRAWHDSVKNTINISVNNGAADSAAHTKGVKASTDPFAIGDFGDSASDGNWNGDIDNVLIAKSAAGQGGVISAAEATRLYNGGTGTEIISNVNPAWLSGLANQHASIGNLLQYERTQAWSVRSTFKIANAPALGALIFANVDTDPDYPGYELWVTAAGLLCVRIIHDIRDSYVGVLGTTNVCDGLTHTAWATYDGGSAAAGVAIYLDGTVETMSTEADTLSTNSIIHGNDFTIASQQGLDSGYYFNGLIKNLLLVDVVRNSTYVGANSVAATLPAADADTQLRLAFDEGGGLTAVDTSQNGYNATLTSALMWTRAKL